MNAVVAPLSKTPARIDLLLRKALLDKLARLENAVLTIRDPLGEFELGSEGTDGLTCQNRCAGHEFLPSSRSGRLDRRGRVLYGPGLAGG